MFPNIKAEIARKGLTIEGLCDTLEFNRKTFYNWMNGVTEVPASAIVKMARFFGVSTDYLLGI